jgi:predicted dehydrogenase
LNGVIGVGVIGCGEIAQIMHLPVLEQLDAFEVTAICDISASVLSAVGERYGVKRRFTDYTELLACEDVEAVVVCTFEHAEIVRRAMTAGKHVLCEKPLGLTVEEVADLPALAVERGVVGLVGYMKLFDPGFEYGRDRIALLDGLTSLHVHDLAGRFDRYQQLYALRRADDVPAGDLDISRQAASDRIATSLGQGHAEWSELYTMLLMLASHDLAVLRALLGEEGRVQFARPVGTSQVLTVLEYPGGLPVVFQAGVGTSYEWWDEWITAYGADTEIRVEFAHPYVRYAPTVVRIREALGSSPSLVVAPVSHDSPFRREWQHFADCVNRGTAPRSDLAGGVADVALSRAIVQALPGSGSKGDG